MTSLLQACSVTLLSILLATISPTSTLVNAFSSPHVCSLELRHASPMLSASSYVRDVNRRPRQQHRPLVQRQEPGKASSSVLLAVTSDENTSPLSDSSSSAGSGDSTGSPGGRSSRRRFRLNRQRHLSDFGSGDGGDAVPPLRRNPPRKVCLMIEPTPFTHVSGYSNRFKEMLRFLSKAGDEVDILTVDSKTPASELPKKFMGYPIRHTQGFTFPLYNHISLTLDLPEMKGAQILERFQPDLIHVTSPGFLLFAALFYARVMKIPLVMSYHTHLPNYGKNYLGFIPRIEKTSWDALRYVHSRADLTLVTSPQMKAELEANGIPRVDVWRKGIDTERFHPSFVSTSMRHTMTAGHPEDFLMVYVGRLGAEKRLKDLRPVLERMPNARLCLVGNGPQKQELQHHFAGTNTVFTGQLQGDDLSAAFASADVFIMPSDSETLGFVVLESMASGVPVVGASAGGLLDLIHDGIDGYLVQPGDTEGYVSKLNLLSSSPVARHKMGLRARKEAEKWGWEAATSYLRNVQYEKALINFHSRAFGGFGRPGTAGMWRLLQWRVQALLRRVDKRLGFFVNTTNKTTTRWWRSIGQKIARNFNHFSFWNNNSSKTPKNTDINVNPQKSATK